MDVDIDFPDRNEILAVIDHIPASITRDGQLVKHNTGIYFQNIPFNPITGSASIDYIQAEERGYFKLDMLNMHAYQDIKNEQHLISLMNQEPDWTLISNKTICDQLPHVNGYHLLLERLKPTNLEQLAMFLALIRPGKKHLTPVVEQHGWDAISEDIWKKTHRTEYEFKRSHSIAYAMLIVVKLNQLVKSN
jgi:DNA polymerase III alpha subunit